MRQACSDVSLMKAKTRFLQDRNIHHSFFSFSHPTLELIYPVVFFFFQKKNQKAFAKDSNLGTSGPRELIHLMILFFFQKKKQKAFVLLRKKCKPNLELIQLTAPIEKRFASPVFAQNSAKPTLGVWGLAPKKSINLLINLSNDILLFPEKEAKSVCFASQKVCWLTINRNPRCSRPRWVPSIDPIVLFFFWKKKQKA
jgi:hypothetical protein